MASDNRHPTDAWLIAINEKFRRDGVHPASRPWHAWRELSIELKLPLELRDPPVVRIFVWFREHTQPASQDIVPLFKGVYFYDAVFWPLTLWPFFGTIRLEPAKALEGMPPVLVGELLNVQASRDEYVAVWCATLDFALSFQDLTEKRPHHQAMAFLHSAHRELTGAASLLLERRPSAKAGHSAMLAVETVGKWFLSEHGWSPERLQKHLGHKVVRILDECDAVLGGESLKAWRDGVAALPTICDRYSSEEPRAHVLWENYRTALFFSARLLRGKTGRDCVRNPAV